MLWHIAWRNLWRHRARTLTMTSAVAFSYGLCLFSMGLGDDGHQQMLDQAAEGAAPLRRPREERLAALESKVDALALKADSAAIRAMRLGNCMPVATIFFSRISWANCCLTMASGGPS